MGTPTLTPFICASVCHANPYLKIASPGKNGLHKGQTLERRSELRGLPRKCPRGPGERGFPGEAICRAHHHRRARGGWGGRVGSLRARRARRERSELKREHTGGMRAAPSGGDKGAPRAAGATKARASGPASAPFAASSTPGPRTGCGTCRTCRGSWGRAPCPSTRPHSQASNRTGARGCALAGRSSRGAPGCTWRWHSGGASVGWVG